jgi:hypothetical protein
MVKKSFIKAYLYICIKNIVLEFEQIKINVSSLINTHLAIRVLKLQFSVNEV